MSVLPKPQACLNVLMVALFLVGCAPSDSGGVPSPTETASKVTQPDSLPPGETKPPPAKARLKADLDAIKAAKKLVCESVMQISFMADDAAFDRSITGEGNALGKIDVAACLQALDLLGNLPDNTENEFIEPLSKVLPKIRECLEVYRDSVGKKPFSDGTGTGPKMAKLGSENHLTLSVAVDESVKLVDPQ